MIWRQTWRPAVYHGIGKRRNYFEGWYYKLVDAAEDHVYAVIPGVFLGPDPASSYSFVQTLDGRRGRTSLQRYPLAAFSASEHDFEIRVGPNCFRNNYLSLDIDAPDLRMQGDLQFTGLTPWPVTLTSPGIMGWYAFVPSMECYHGVLSLDHRIDGTLVVDGQKIDFAGGRGYIEKDWGQSFPRAWIWLQTNHFGSPGTSLTASVATIPWLGGAFRGFIVGLWYEGQLYRFATYTKARIESLELNDYQVAWSMTGLAGDGKCRGRYRLDIVAGRAEGGLLHAPFRDGLQPRVVESLTAAAELRLWRMDPQGNRLIFDGLGRHAGLEINGELHEVIGH